MNDYYAILGIDSDAALTAVKSAYRKKAAEFHPDRNPSPDAPQQFRQAQEAYEILADPTSRLAFDESRRRSLVESPLHTAEAIWTTYLNKVLQ